MGGSLIGRDADPGQVNGSLHVHICVQFSMSVSSKMHVSELGLWWKETRFTGGKPAQKKGANANYSGGPARN